MKILHVVYDFTPGDFRGGIAKVVYELALQQEKIGHQVTVFTPRVRQEFLVASILPRNITVQTTQTMKIDSVSQCIENLVSQHDVVHSHNTFHLLNRHVASASKHSKVPAFFHVHGALDPVVVNKGFLKAIKKNIYIRLIEQKNLNSAHGIFALTDSEKSQLQHWKVTTPIHVVPNGIKTLEEPTPEEIEAFKARFPLMRDAQLIVYLGRINPKKGLEILIRSFENIAEKFPKAILVIAGDRSALPQYVACLDAQIAKAGLEKRVVWTGFLNEVEKRNIFALADIFSHVTISEGMAMAVLEAMSAGVSTIVSPGCYMDDAVRQNAVLLAQYDADSLTLQMVDLLSHPELRTKLSANAQNYIAENHDWRGIASKIIDVYQASLKSSHNIK